jgi:RNA polymerase sigma factor (sigma-70 family)
MLDPKQHDDASPEIWPESAEELAGLVDRYSDRLFTYACRRLGDFHEAEDVVQEVFLRILEGRARQRSVENVGAYLFRMVTNACIDRQRLLRRRGTQAPQEATDEAQPSSGDPAQLLALVEETRRIEETLRALPPVQAEAVRLRVFGELSLEEIAQIEGCSVNTVSSRLRYAFARLRRTVERETRP